VCVLEQATPKKQTIPENCISVKRQNIIIEGDDQSSVRPSVEIEGEYIFNDQYEMNFYNSQDAKDLENEFKKIDKM
jgi:hypothetical protein